MATVTGYTAARMKEIEDKTVVSGAVNQTTKHLILTTRDGTPIDAGVLEGPKGDKGDPGLGNVNTVNAKFGPDIVLNAVDVGAVPTTQFSTEAQRGIIELATTPEAIALVDTDRAITPRTLAAVKDNRWERVGSSLIVLGSGLYAGQTALLTLASNTFPFEVIWTGSRWEPVSWKLSGSNTQRTAFEISGVCFEGVEWYSTTDKNSRLWNGSAWVLNTSGLVPISPISAASSGAGTVSVGSTGLITFAGIPGVKLSGVFSSDYKYYKVLYKINGVSGTTTSTLFFRYMAAGVDNAVSYSNAGPGLNTAGASKPISSGNVTGGTCGYVSSTYPQAAGDFTIYQPFDPVNTTLMGQMQGMDASQAFGSALMVIHQQNGSYDGFFMYVLSPALITGTLRFYGFN